MTDRLFWTSLAMLALTLAIGCDGDDRSSSVQGAPEAEVRARQNDEGSIGPQQPGRDQIGDQAPSSFDAPPPAGTRAHCPVMGHDFIVSESSPRSEHNGRHYVFCCPACKPQFDANPERYTNG